MQQMPDRADLIKEFLFDSTSDFSSVVNYKPASKNWTTGDKHKTMRVDGASNILEIGGNGHASWAQIRMSIPPADLSNCHGYLFYKLDPNDPMLPADGNTMKRMQLAFYGNNVAIDIGVSVSSSEVQTRKGWFCCSFTSEQYSNGNPAVDMSKVTDVFIRPFFNTGWQGKITMGYLGFFKKPAKARCTFRIDDGSHPLPHDQLTKFKIAHALGIKVALAAIGHNADVDPQFFTLDQMKQLRDMGHIICNHLWSISGTNNVRLRPGWRYSDSNKRILTKQSDRRDQINRMADWMERNGLGDYSRLIIVPGGMDHPLDRELINEGTARALWYTEGIGAPTGTGIGTGNYLAWPYHSRTEFYANRLTDSMPLATVKTSIDNLVVSRGYDTIYCHSQTTSDWKETLEHALTHVAAGNLEIVNMDDFFPGGLSTLPRSSPGSVAHLNPTTNTTNIIKTGY